MTKSLHPDMVRLRLTESRIPRQFASLRLTDIPESEARDVATGWLEHLNQYYVTENRDFERFPLDDPFTAGKGLILVGPPGTGKTTLAMTLLVEVLHRHPRIPLHFVEVANLISLHMERIRYVAEDERGWVAEQEIRRIEEAGVLVLDDLGKEHKGKSGYAEDEIFRLLRTRHLHARPTIITSNLPVSQWEDYESAMVSFARRAFTTVVMA